jgi:glycosyltransferase involved in cell wall biosynthesis
MAVPPRLLYVVSEDWYFLSHRLPMARAARDADFEVHVATNVADGAAAILGEGFFLHAVPFARGRLSPLATWRTIRTLRMLQQQLAPAVAHRVALQPVVLGALAALGLPGASVNAITGLGYTFTSGSARARMARFAIGAALQLLVNRARSVALVQNSDDAAMLAALKFPATRVALIAGSGVDVVRLRPLPEPAGPPTIAFVGRLIDIKGVRTLVAAHRLLRAKYPTITLLIAGTPDPANASSIPEDEVRRWVRDDDVICLGHVADIATVWARASIAVQPSRGGEGLPKSLLEAAACGRPLVASDVPGCREIAIAGETGLLVPPDNPPALALAIGRLIAAPDLRARYGAAARRLAVERFSADGIGRQTVDLYRELVRLDAGGVATDDVTKAAR